MNKNQFGLRHLVVLYIISAFLLIGNVSFAQTHNKRTFFQPISDLILCYYYNMAERISAYKKIFVGQSSSGVDKKAFYWSFSDGMVGLGFLNEQLPDLTSMIFDISPDGLVIVRSCKLSLMISFMNMRHLDGKMM